MRDGEKKAPNKGKNALLRFYTVTVTRDTGHYFKVT